MSLLETPMVRAYWGGQYGQHGVGGTLIEEFVLVPQSPTSATRRADALILLDGDRRIASWREGLSPAGHDVVVVQAKAHRLGMYLMGQAVFSEILVRRLNPKSVKVVALCTQDDSVLHPLLNPYPSVEVVVVHVPLGPPLAQASTT